MSWVELSLRDLAVFQVANLAWHSGYVSALPLALILALFLGLAKAGRDSALVAACYFAGALWPTLPGGRVFFGDRVSLPGIIVLFVLWVAALSAPFYFAGQPGRRRWMALTGVIVAESLLPIGIASPLLAGIALFPGAGWLGLLFAVVMIGALAKPDQLVLGVLCGCSIALNAIYVPPASSPWQGVDTALGKTGFDKEGIWRDFETMQTILSSTRQEVSVYPEGTISLWTGLSDAWFAPGFLNLAANRRSVLFGATRQIGPRERQPVLLARGRSTAEYVERFPVPMAEWGNDTPIHPFAPGTITVEGKRAGVLLCYEQLLLLPAVESFAEGAQALIAPSNLYWAPENSIDHAQDVSVKAWGRLFHVPVVRSVNR